MTRNMGGWPSSPTRVPLSGLAGGEYRGALRVNETRWTWNELMTRDPEASKAFFADVFGWTYQPMDMGGAEYNIVHVDGGSGDGGIMPMPSEVPGTWFPNYWGVYFAVKTTPTLRPVEAAVAAGASLTYPPMDIGVSVARPGWRTRKGANFAILGPHTRIAAGTHRRCGPAPDFPGRAGSEPDASGLDSAARWTAAPSIQPRRGIRQQPVADRFRYRAGLPHRLVCGACVTEQPLEPGVPTPSMAVAAAASARQQRRAAARRSHCHPGRSEPPALGFRGVMRMDISLPQSSLLVTAKAAKRTEFLTEYLCVILPVAISCLNCDRRHYSPRPTCSCCRRCCCYCRRRSWPDSQIDVLR